MDHIRPDWIDPQEWASMRPFPLNPAYLVSPKGRVLNVRQNGWLSPCVMKRGGYYAVNIWENNRARLWTLNRIVAWTFHGAPIPPKNHAAHEDGDKSNNAVQNIFWKTRVENEADKIRHGTNNRGERNGAAKLSDAQVREIISLGVNQPRGIVRKLSAQFGISESAVSSILRGKRRQYHE